MGEKQIAEWWYPKDWLTDMELHKASATARGVWIDLLNHMMLNKTGSVTGTVDELAQLASCSPQDIDHFIEEVKRCKFAGVRTVVRRDSHKIVTVMSRRLTRKENKRKSSRLRQERHRRNATVTKKSTLSIQPPSTPSTKPPGGPYEKEALRQQIHDLGEDLKQTGKWKGVHPWIAMCLRDDIAEQDILYTLAVIADKPDGFFTKGVTGFANAVVKRVHLDRQATRPHVPVAPEVLSKLKEENTDEEKRANQRRARAMVSKLAGGFKNPDPETGED